ncbi:MAG: VOC family protein [Cytophagaceae bacterium]|nr:VOC family protein [Gemmatimonadaceae bacterium]
MSRAQKITPFLWYNGNAEEAIKLYTSIFKESRIVSLMRTDGSGPEATGPVIMGSFELHGQVFHVLNGGPQYKFTEAVSLFVSCDTQEEIDHLWSSLTADGGEESQCGWLKDKFGLSWQIIPSQLVGLLGHQDRAKAGRAQQAMLKMQKLDIRALQEA